MNWLEAIKQSLTFTGTSARPSRSSQDFPVDPRELHFTRNAISKMGQWHLSEADVKDVFYHGGTIVKPNMMVKKYSGYEVGLYYFQDTQTGQFVISSAWRRDRY